MTTPGPANAAGTAGEVLVVIPTLNEEAHIEGVLETLLAACSETKSFTVVVVDGGSQDQTAEIVRGFSARCPSVHLLHNPQKLQSAGVNLAVARFAEPRHRYLVRMDAHATYPSNYVSELIFCLQEKQVAAVATVLESHGESCFQRAVVMALSTPFGTGGSAHRGGHTSGFVDHGHHAAFDLEAWKDIKGYDAQFSVNEDAELDVRFRRSGYRIWLNANIRVRYIVRATLAKLGLQYWRYGVGRARTVRKHRIRPAPRQLLPALAFAVNFSAIALASAAPVLLALPGLYGALIAGVTIWFWLKNKSRCALLVFPVLLAMHMCWGAGFIYGLIRFRKRRRCR